MLTVVPEPDGGDESRREPRPAVIDELVREGARRMLAAALEAEVNQYIAELAAETDERGRRLVVRNGHHRPRTVVTAAGPVEVTAPRVNDRRVDEATGERKRFSSKISPWPCRGYLQPPWCRKSPKTSEVLPLLCLYGLYSGDFVPALEQFLGSSAGLSAATIIRLARQWQADHAAFMDRDLAEVDHVYVWADGIHLNVRLEEAKACALVLVGMRADGSKELVALKDGYRESGESWADLLRDCARRGMRAPILAAGDGALGFWKAPAEVFPETREQRCWAHKTANVLDSMPKSAQPGAQKAIRNITGAKDKQHAEAAVKTFARLYGAKFPEAVKKITDDRAELLTFYDFPAEHWIHLRTKVTRGAGSRTAALAMVFKLVETAQQGWRTVNAPHLVALVRAGARFEHGRLVERPEAVAA